MALTYSITGGADAAKFNINGTSGALTFKAPPDFETPGDADHNNIYQVEVGVSDGTATTKQMVNVTVTNVADENLPPQFTSPAAFTVPENQTTVATLTATDPDAGGPVEPPIEPPPTGGYPGASNTGVPPGTVMQTLSGNQQSTAAGQSFVAKKIDGVLLIFHPNCKVQKCQVHSIHVGHDGADGSGTLIEDCTTVAGSWNTGFSMVKCNNSIVRRCNIGGKENGIWLEGSGVQILDNWFHAPSLHEGAHADGIQIPFGPNPTNCVIKHNNFELPGSSSCMTMGDVTNHEICYNRINGGSYCIYYNHDSKSNCHHNDFISYTFGWMVGNEAGVVLTQNTFAGGAPINGLPAATAEDTSKKKPDHVEERVKLHNKKAGKAK